MTDRPREVLDFVAFHELRNRLRPQFASDEAYIVHMLGFLWGRERSALRYATRKRYFHQDRIRDR